MLLKWSNWNFMLPGLVYEYEGVDGLKTGTTTLQVIALQELLKGMVHV